LGTFVRFVKPLKAKHMAEHVRAIAGAHRLAIDPQDMKVDTFAEWFLSSLQLLKIYHPCGFHPPIRLVGREHIDEGLKQGRGVILWAAPFYHANPIEPMAFDRAGIRLHHLSHRNHGPSSTRFGVRWLNRVLTAAEDRFLAERIVIQPGNASALLSIRKRIVDNALVSIRANAGSQWVLNLRFLAGRTQLATGAVELALTTGAALLPVFTVRNQYGEYVVNVESPIEVVDTGDRMGSIDGPSLEFIKRLERYVLEYPDQWFGWTSWAYPWKDDGTVRLPVRSRRFELPAPNGARLESGVD